MLLAGVGLFGRWSAAEEGPEVDGRAGEAGEAHGGEFEEGEGDGLALADAGTGKRKWYHSFTYARQRVSTVRFWRQ